MYGEAPQGAEPRFEPADLAAVGRAIKNFSARNGMPSEAVHF